MKFTGERVIPGEGDADLFNEHRARYLFAQRFSSGKRVLDAACGSGYGSALLAENATAVLGVDIAKEAVEYARLHYGSPKVRFAQADCAALPSASAQFDLVVAFEIIEHLKNPEAFLAELKRVLQPSGLLLLSTPNRLYYTEDRGEVNPFHHREFSFSELDELLRSFFAHHAILFENHVAALLVAGPEADTNPAVSLAAGLVQEDSKRPSTAEERARAAHYLVALCSAQPLQPIPPLLYLPSTGNVLRERETHIHLLGKQLDEAKQERDLARARFLELGAPLQKREKELNDVIEERTRWARELDQKLAEKDAYVLQLQADYDAKIQWAMDLQRELEQTRSALQRLQQEFEERTAWALKLDSELKDRQEDLRLLYSSRWYRIGKNLRLSPIPSSDQGGSKSGTRQ